jgi:hypothetical protein
MLEKPKKSFSKELLSYFIQKTSNSYVSFRLLLEEAVTKLFIFSFLMTSGRKDEI